ncbi:hypothetical protein MAR_012445, partial [Mya arenaria]
VGFKKISTQYEFEGRPDVVRLISANSMTKIKVILNCRMERTSILTGDVISEPASFHSNIEINLEGTDRVVIGSSKISLVWRYIQSSINHCEVILIFHFPTSLNQKRQS